VPGRADAGQRRPGHLDAAGGAGAALHADAARHGVEPELDDRVSDPDRADQATPGRAGANEQSEDGCCQRSGVPAGGSGQDWLLTSWASPSTPPDPLPPTERPGSGHSCYSALATNP